ncbi:hypothetical protein QBC37DRAFT_391177 [Rhypophila decipiens]|uniref:RNase H type-1 domain-containing protein n=1 Tax=Rhypophila decipiens TaxID=261697 RepID=A0AAN6XZN2_9PEZI|nr:hypothetical protein QBC37DRAFT_391177 [Rhypophila decipiens]
MDATLSSSNHPDNGGVWIPRESDLVRAYGYTKPSLYDYNSDDYNSDVCNFDDYNSDDDDSDSNPRFGLGDLDMYASDHDDSDSDKQMILYAYSKCGCRIKDLDDQLASQRSHKADCDAIRACRETLDAAYKKFHATPRTYMNDYYWDTPDCYDYLKARFNLAVALLKVDSDSAVDQAIDNFRQLLTESGFDKMGVRDYIPHLLLRVRCDSNCYRFITECGKWSFGDYDTIMHHGWLYFPWHNITDFDQKQTPNVFEPVDNLFQTSRPSLSHLVALTFLKLSLFLDIRALELAEQTHKLAGPGISTTLRRPVREVSSDKYLTNRAHSSILADQLRGEYENLFRVVHDANSFFWTRLAESVDSGTAKEPNIFADFCVHHPQGTEGEADRVVFQSVKSWLQDPEAIQMMRDMIRAFTPLTSRLGQELSDTPVNHNPLNIPVSRRIIPGRFSPPTDVDCQYKVYRPGMPQEGELVCITAGLCEGKVAGWAVTVKNPAGKVKFVSGRLEQRGPTGDTRDHTTIRAELRAAVAALRMTDFHTKGVRHVILATNSAYVPFGCTAVIHKWLSTNTWTDMGKPVDNNDLWNMLLVNIDASVAARDALSKPDVEMYQDVGLAGWDEHKGRTRVVQLSLLKNGHGRAPTTPGVASPTSIWYDIAGPPSVASEWDCTIERVRTTGMALSRLKQGPRKIIITHGCKSPLNNDLLSLLTKLIHEGSTVVIGGAFARSVEWPALNGFFEGLELSWKVSHKSGEMLINRVPGRGNDDLADKYVVKTALLERVSLHAAWYAYEKRPGATAVAFVKIGDGRLGFVGDIDGEKTTRAIVKKMLDL